ncbi:Hsp20/alpha crystallin family protein [Herbiconiux sp. VKM Ac-1786]|uniref:Hsp20/alpha crystallin family protein n=1 Tax=Herbiconiux sp. VKM Ac-1786 TaxID=2783824 RepID=UPI00188B16AB|nr:Hsp20/alpha crystallin family protein [Herbiconiux sp. VKM Ac-1786]MBF4571941.1 Hsp20/alpha crystallin family protein [Herbiconiux sp. VKM Ac-1786]
MARNLVRFDPFAELTALQKQFFSDGPFSSPRTATLPTTDVYTEDDNQLTVEAHLPNFAEDDVTVNIDQGALVIQAEKHLREEDAKKKYVVRESSTSFYRRIDLPEQADDDQVQATFDNGVLKVTVPFRQLPSPKKVAITTSTRAPHEAVPAAPESAPQSVNSANAG